MAEDQQLRSRPIGRQISPKASTSLGEGELGAGDEVMENSAMELGEILL
jgi:hypothetical protein